MNLTFELYLTVVLSLGRIGAPCRGDVPLRDRLLAFRWAFVARMADGTGLSSVGVVRPFLFLSPTMADRGESSLARNRQAQAHDISFGMGI